MATIVEAFDGMHQNITADRREYSVKYNVKGFALVSEFPASFTWQGHSDPYARLTGLTTGRQLGPLYFEITANYSTLPADNAQKKSEKDQPANPILRSVKRSWSSGYIEVYRPADLDGVKYAAKNGESFSGGLSIRVPYLIKRYTRNEAYFPETTALSSIYHTDSSKLILCTRFDGSESMEDNGVTFCEVQYEFWCLKSGSIVKWEDKQLNVGSYYLDSNGKKKYKSDGDDANALIPGAIWLANDGTQLAAEADPIWLTFRNHDVTSFAGLGLPGV